MTKLTDTQLIVLSKAAQREDGTADLPSGIPKVAALKLSAALIREKLMREVLSKPGMPIWRKDDESRSISLVLLKAGRDAIHIEDDAAAASSDTSVPRSSDQVRNKRGQPATRQRRKSAADRQGDNCSTDQFASSKRSRIIAMLSKPSGTTVEELSASTGWLHHTTRAMLTGLRKTGFVIERQRATGEACSTYRITAHPANKA